MAKTKIHLEDKGQDFLWLLCDENGTVEEAGPFQSSIWKGSYIPVDNEFLLEVGELCPIHNEHIKYGFLNYKVTKIETIEN